MATQTDARPGVFLPQPLRRFPLYGFLGAAVLLCATAALFMGDSFVRVYFTPIAWTAYILIADATLWMIDNSFIRTRTREFLFMLPWSVVCWLIFEGFNLYLQNWRYVGLPENAVARAAGYVWSFATIFPAILLTAEIIKRGIGPLRMRFPIRGSRRVLYGSIGLGTAMLVLPLLLPQEIASKLFAFVWVGFILVLDPIIFLRGGRSILGQLEKGDAGLLVSLMASGLVCGVLWELWNYWAGAKWLYNVPLAIAGPKIFEMPLLGYLGFIPFAVECFVMNEFLYVLLPTVKKSG